MARRASAARPADTLRASARPIGDSASDARHDPVCPCEASGEHRQTRRDRDHEVALRLLDVARDYFEMIGAEPGPELLEAIARMERKLD